LFVNAAIHIRSATVILAKNEPMFLPITARVSFASFAHTGMGCTPVAAVDVAYGGCGKNARLVHGEGGRELTNRVETA
jgi:hypothetical protein